MIVVNVNYVFKVVYMDMFDDNFVVYLNLDFFVVSGVVEVIVVFVQVLLDDWCVCYVFL